MSDCIFCARTGGVFEHISDSHHVQKRVPKRGTATKPKPIQIPANLAVISRIARCGHAPSLELLRAAVRTALEMHAGDRGLTAQTLKVSQRVLHYWLLPLSEPRGLGMDDLARQYPRPRGRPRNKTAPVEKAVAAPTARRKAASG